MLNSLRHCIIRTMSTTPSASASSSSASQRAFSATSAQFATGGSSSSNFSKAAAERQLKPSEVDFMRLIEKRNLERVTKLRLQRKRNIWTGLTIGATVISIYLYSMLAVKQERFLDDFNEPQKVSAEDAAAAN